MKKFLSIWVIGCVLVAVSMTRANEKEGVDGAVVKDEPSKVGELSVQRFEVLGQLPLEEVIKDLRQSFPRINFVIDPEAKDITVSEILLRSAALEDIMTAISIATGGEARGARLNERMVTFSARRRETKPICRAFSLNTYLGARSEEERGRALQHLEEALQKCWSMLEVKDPPQLSLHPATRLMIVVGRPEEVAVVEQVISEVERGARAVEPGKPPGANSTEAKPTEAN